MYTAPVGTAGSEGSSASAGAIKPLPNVVISPLMRDSVAFVSTRGDHSPDTGLMSCRANLSSKRKNAHTHGYGSAAEAAGGHSCECRTGNRLDPLRGRAYLRSD